MLVQYDVVVTIINIVNGSTSKFTKTLQANITAATDALLYNNNHIVAQAVYLHDVFADEIQAYATAMGIQTSSIQIDEFEITSANPKVDIFFEFDSQENEMKLRPTIKCYVHPKNEALVAPELRGAAYDSRTIIWSWKDDGCAHYLVEEAIDINNSQDNSKIIAQLPLGISSFTETGLEPNTQYTRRLIAYTNEQSSPVSAPCTVQTEIVPVEYSLEEYCVSKNYDFTSDDTEREMILKRMKAFHSGIGDFTDLKVYKQMDADFYQKFKAYFEITGRRIERERRYDQVGFHYKVCMEAQETVEEQEGEVTFDVFAYPREWVTIEDYIWVTQPIKVKTKFVASVFLRKENAKYEPEELQLFAPIYESSENVEDITATVAFAEPTSIIISVDFSSSMLDYINGKQRIDSVIPAIEELIKTVAERVEKAKKEIIGTDVIETHVKPFKPDELVQYVIVKWATLGKCIYNGFNPDEAIAALKESAAKLKQKNYDGIGSYTNFYEGLNVGWGYIKDAEGNEYNSGGDYQGEKKRKVVGQIFFTDGFANVYTQQYGDSGYYRTNPTTIVNETYTPYDQFKGRSCIPVLTSIRIDVDRPDSPWLKALQSQCKTHVVMSTGINNFDDAYPASKKENILDMCAAIVHRCKGTPAGHNDFFFQSSWYNNDPAQGPYITKDTINELYETYIQKCHYPDYNSAANDDGLLDKTFSVNDLANAFIDGLDMFEVKTVITGQKVTIDNKFQGWKIQSEEQTTTHAYSLDDIKVVHVESEEFEFEFNNTITPVEYVRKSRRAIVPKTSFVPPTKLSNTNMYDLIMELVRKTPEWADEYKYTIGTVENNGEDDAFLIKGLHIQNTYQYADEDVVFENDWGASEYEDGMEGTVNSFTDIDKASSATYGDDCYLVSKNNYLMIQGYTDGIIYDGTRYIHTELNAYDRPMEIIASASGNYDSELFNRKNPSRQYNNGGPYSHVFDLIQRDDDIILEGNGDMVKPGDWQQESPLTHDLVARIERWYKSPILNYRFNMEDPDAKTPIAEILPDCDPNNNYRHIVLLHVYYAKNVWISDTSNYVSSFGNDPIATLSSPYLPLTEDIYKWTKREWRDRQENGWYIDDYLWFMAKKMTKVQDYYDELPGPGMESFYGLVNNRYRTDGQDGKKDLRVDVPQFNIPTTVHRNTIKIYIVITEFHPDSAIVSYKWEHPWNNKDSITQVNGDYVTFSADSITYKDVEYFDVLATINMENQEIYGHKTTECFYSLAKPNTMKPYVNYYLEVFTNNADILAMRYPHEIVFGQNNLAEVGVAFKGVVNATSKWSPRIHNGYYYLNQHEYFAYSEFNVEANFETYEELIYKEINGYITIEVLLRHIAQPTEYYSLTKDTRSELLQDEKAFQWVDGKGLTLKPIIDGIYYRDYTPTMYYSPIIHFPNKLTTAGFLRVDYFFEDGSTVLPMEVRSYDLSTGQWSNWVPFVNNTVPNTPLSHAYQVRFLLQASVQNLPYFIEDYLCCYLDWKDDMSEPNTTNIVTITDHMTTGPYQGEGVFVSKILDFGCISQLQLDIFQSKYRNNIQLLIARSDDDAERLLLENVVWEEVPSVTQRSYSGRFFRYKIVIPEGEKLYWLHKRINTTKTSELMPYITGIHMNGSYEPQDVVVNFINTESFTIPKDGQYHTVFSSVSDIIMANVLERGYTEDEIESVTITCTTQNVNIQYNQNINNLYPKKYLGTPIEAMSDIDIETLIKNTPYILVEQDLSEEHYIVPIKGTPQQYCPITVEDPDGNTYIQMHYATSFVQQQEYITTEDTKYIELPTNRYDPLNLVISLDGQVMNSNDYTITNHLVIFKNFIGAGHKITVDYCILYSFMADVDRVAGTTTIYLHTGENIPMPTKVKVFFETSERNNKFVANELSLNPIYRTDYKGFIYLTDDHNEPYKINIYCNPLRLKAGGYDKVDIAIEVLDIKDNPVIEKEIAVDCSYGILNCDKFITDINGVVHVLYESAYLTCNDPVTVRVLDDSGNVISESITIVNE